MVKRVQKRSQETRARLISSARSCVSEFGYAGLRVEDVVHRAGVSKGTFFVHFTDKDGLMEYLIGEEMKRLLVEMERSPTPASIEEFIEGQIPLLMFMSQDRYTFDVILRHSGAAASDSIGPISHVFHDHAQICHAWVKGNAFRPHVSSEILANGVMAFMMHVTGLGFCALHSGLDLKEHLEENLRAWLT